VWPIRRPLGSDRQTESPAPASPMTADNHFVLGPLTRWNRVGLICVLLIGLVVPSRAEVVVVPDAADWAVFGNGKRTFKVLLRNSGNQAVEVNLSYRLLQIAGRTAAPLGGPRIWRTVPIGTGQTVVESPELDLPEVRGETVFHIIWSDDTTKLGTTALRVFPDGLLQPLLALAGGGPIGLVDPEARFKPAVGGLNLQELKEAEAISSSEARLIFVAPMAATNQPAGLVRAIRTKAAGGAAVVWWQAPSRAQAEFFPEVYVLEEGSGRVVVATAGTVLTLAESPRAQRTLVRLAELAVGKTKLKWPEEAEP